MTSAATEQIRVAIVGEQSGADIALPTGIPIRDLIPRIRTTLETGSDSPPQTDGQDSNAEPLAEEVAPLRPLSLAPIGGVPFSLDVTLGNLGIRDGEELMLCELPPGPTAPPVVEDFADAAAIHSRDQFSVFTTEVFRRAVAVPALAGLAFATGFAAYTWYQDHSWWTLAALMLCALVPAAVTIGTRNRNPKLSAIAGVATIAPLALAVAAANTGGYGAPRVLFAAAVVAAWSLVLSVTNRYVALHTAVLVTSIALVAVTAARILFHLPNATLGCILLLTSLLLAHNAPTAATRWAKFPLQDVPAPGDPMPKPPKLKVLEDLPRRAAMARGYQVGIIAASVVLLVIGSVLVLWLPDRPWWLSWWLVVACTLVTVLRLRVWEFTADCLWFLAAPLLVTCALAVMFTATGHTSAGQWAAAALVGLVAVVIGSAFLGPKSIEIPRRRYLDLAENMLLYTLIPTALVLTGVISLILNRRAG
ncbi:type VII secretion integral membrane protein EccD [Mycobacteroides abscessus subsp. abscessus]|uniref:type VII secretion integral membrane protein EccD n=1 Tax=Mycobacteroides abscessus TaxID=36809 RepID=UPI0009294478|nr:type VII secretion integral membrane protein EccD [Mycobacteroides abscessus]SIJ22095.1 type VII secretion integral membrane protein EccD [Mycobacteroides abscessus subsp. abscessus]SLH38562.1 type VII secretion integral membrane protein EccD [Mycobacteroides abscessus subsp. abscessus]